MTSVCISPDGKFIASGDFAGKVIFWSIQEKKVIYERFCDGDYIKGIGVKDATSVYTLSYARVGAASGPIVRLWDLKKGTSEKPYYHPFGTSFGFSPDGKFLVHECWEFKPQLGEDYVIRWSEPLGKQVKYKLPGSPRDLTALAISSDSSLLAVGNKNGIVKVWNVPQEKEVRSFNIPNRAVTGISFSQDNKALAAAFALETVKVWEISTGNTLSTLVKTGSSATPLHFSADSKLLTVGLGQLWTWDWRTLKLAAWLEGNGGQVTALGCSTDGQWLVVGTNTGMVNLWEAPNGKNYK